MARNMPRALNLTAKLFTKSLLPNVAANGTRLLYAPAALGMDSYTRTRQSIQNQFLNMGDKFREKMRTYAMEDTQNLIFTEDLKNMLHLVKNNPEDIELLRKMVVKFNSQNKEIRFGSFHFGPVIMRAYHYLNKPEEAFQAFIDPANDGLFDQFMTYKILLDLLYNHNKFAEMKKVFEIATSRPVEGTKYPNHVVVLILGGCYKENTPESLEYAMDVWHKLQEVGHEPMRRASTFFAGLALRQGKPDVALEVVFGIRQVNYVTVRNIKVAALALLDRLDDVVPLLRSSLSRDDPSKVKHTYTREVVETLEKAMERAQLTQEDTLYRMVQQLRNNEHVVDQTLDELICSEIQPLPRLPSQQQNQFDNFDQRSRQGFRPQSSNRFSNRYQRPGLKELI